MGSDKIFIVFMNTLNNGENAGVLISFTFNCEHTFYTWVLRVGEENNNKYLTSFLNAETKY